MRSADFSGDAFAVYQQLKAVNPSPYSFFMRDHQGVLLGCSPELALRVTGDDKKGRTVEIDPIAGTKPRGLFADGVDIHKDSRYEIALKLDEKELAEHVMLIDLARNDIASIAKPGTTIVKRALFIEKYSHVQHLVSEVMGALREDIDALTAYIATMNMGTLTGAPKPMAQQIIAAHEANGRGYFGGGFGVITFSGEMETAIVIRSLRFKRGKVYARAAAGIVADSVPESEYEETLHKMRATLQVLKEVS